MLKRVGKALQQFLQTPVARTGTPRPTSIPDIISSQGCREGFPVVAHEDSPGELFAITHFCPEDPEGGCMATGTPARVGLARVNTSEAGAQLVGEEWIHLLDEDQRSTRVLETGWRHVGWFNAGYEVEVDDGRGGWQRALVAHEKADSLGVVAYDRREGRHYVGYHQRSRVRGVGRQIIQGGG